MQASIKFWIGCWEKYNWSAVRWYKPFFPLNLIFLKIFTCSIETPLSEKNCLTSDGCTIDSPRMASRRPFPVLSRGPYSVPSKASHCILRVLKDTPFWKYKIRFELPIFMVLQFLPTLDNLTNKNKKYIFHFIKVYFVLKKHPTKDLVSKWMVILYNLFYL